MKVYNENWEQLETWDEKLGRLHPSIRIIHHQEIQKVQEQGHWEVIATYPETGGQDVQWIIDVPGVQYTPAWDEKQQCYVYKLFTEQQLAEIERIKNTLSTLQLLQALMEGIANAQY